MTSDVAGPAERAEDPLEAYLVEHPYPLIDDDKFGRALLFAARVVAPEETAERVNRLGEPWSLGGHVKRFIGIYNTERWQAIGQNMSGLRSDEYGDLREIKPRGWSWEPRCDKGTVERPLDLKSIVNPRDVADDLRKRLMRAGVFPFPETSMEEIVTNLESQTLLSDDHELGMSISGGEKIPECIELTVGYARDHEDEIPDMIRELYHAGSIYDDFLFDEERGSRAALYRRIKDLIVRHSDGHVMSIGYRSNDFTHKILPILLGLVGYTVDSPESQRRLASS